MRGCGPAEAGGGAVPVILPVCSFCTRTRHWFPAGPPPDVTAAGEVARP
jgi:hypothetical protein